MNVQQLLESSNQFKKISDDSARLSAKWEKSGLLKNLPNEQFRDTVSVLLENQAKQLVSEGNVTGGTTSQNGGGYSSENWAGVALPLVRRVFGEIAAKEFVSVQPMNLPSGLVFYLDFKYGTNKAPFSQGTSMYGADPKSNVTVTDNTVSGSLYGAGRFGYSINNYTASVTATTSSATWSTFNFDDTYSSSFSTYTVLTTSTGSVNADLNGVRGFVISSSAAGIAPNNVLQTYTTTNGTQVNFVVTSSLAGIASGSFTVTLIYEVQPTPDARGDFEDTFGATTNEGGSSNIAQPQPIAIPEVQVQLKSEPIVAKTRKLKAQWTPEFAQDLNAYHSVDAEAELTGILSQYISMEIDLELLDMLIKNAYSVDYWSAQNNVVYNGSSFVASTSGYYNAQGGWFQTLGTKLQKISNKIHQLTMRGGANFLVTSPTVSTVLESIPGFASDGDGEKFEYNFGIQKVGSLNNRYKVYKNPYMTENIILLGYKGAQFLECGAVYAPYVPLIMTPLLYDPNTFTPRKGLLTRYAKKMIRPDYYGKIYVAGLNTI